MSWLVIPLDIGETHVVPHKDTYEHTLDLDCWCDPSIDPTNEFVVVHNSNDRREDYENA